MNRRTLAFVSLAVALSAAGFAFAEEMEGMPGMHTGSPPPATTSQPAAQAVDVGNTVCPVSGDKVGGSKLVEVYDGKIYHLCCDDCPKDFKKDPAKYAKMVADDPAKYGVKK